MAVSSTTGTSSIGTMGSGNVIDVSGIVGKLDAVEQVPIDRVNSTITKNNVAISDMGTIKAKMASLQTALQDLTDPLSYKNKTATSSDSTVVSAAVSGHSSANAGDYNIQITSLAKAYVGTYGGNSGSASQIADPAAADTAKLQSVFGLNGTTTLYVKATGDAAALAIDLSTYGSLNAVRDRINSQSMTVRASVVDTGYGYSLTLTSVAGGADNSVAVYSDQAALPTLITPATTSAGTDAVFMVNGQSFKRTSNTVENAIPGVRLQLSKPGESLVTISSASSDYAQTLVTNVGQAYNDLVASYQKLAAYDPDPEKRGSLYGDSTLMDVMNGLASSLMTGFKKLDGSALNNTNGKPVSLVSLGLELQRDGTVTFNAEMFNNAEGLGVFEQLADGFVAPTRTSVNAAIGLTGETGMIGTDLTGLKDLNTTLQTQVKDLEERKASKMAKYQAQYAALDALLYRLQSLNSSLTATFDALNNQNNK